MTEGENFAGLVSGSAERVRYKAGDVIIKEGERGDRMFILTAGRAQITIRNDLLETVEEGGVFGEMALVDAGPRGATVAAQTDCEVVPVDGTSLRIHGLSDAVLRAPADADHLQATSGHERSRPGVGRSMNRRTRDFSACFGRGRRP
jgi:Cyclic nucleotide-binding domain